MPESTVIPQHDLMALQGDDSALLAETSVRKDLSAASSPPESLGSPCSSPRAARDSTWLQIEVCRDYRRDTCPRGDDCRFAHPEAKVMGKDSKVTCCYDFLKGRCKREYCKYYHPPSHIKEKLVNAGRQFGAMMLGTSSRPQMFPTMPLAFPGQGWGAISGATVSQGPGISYADRLPICSDFLMGQCLSPSCPFVHPGEYVRHNVDQTVTVCHNYVRGLCYRGDKCRYYHPPLPPYFPQEPLFNGSLPVGQGLPLGQPHLFPVYSPPPFLPAMGMQPAFFPSPVTPSMPMVPIMPSATTASIPAHLFPVQQVMIPTPVSIINSEGTEDGEHKW